MQISPRIKIPKELIIGRPQQYRDINTQVFKQTSKVNFGDKSSLASAGVGAGGGTILKYLRAPYFFFNDSSLFLTCTILFIVGYSGSSLLCGLFSSCSKQVRLFSCVAWTPHCGGFSCCRAQALVIVAYRLSSCGSWALERGLNSCGTQVSCSAARGIFPDQGSNPCLLHWQVNSLPLSHQGNLEHPVCNKTCPQGKLLVKSLIHSGSIRA